MKKYLLIFTAIFAILVTGCDSVREYHNTKSYKIYTTIDKDLAYDKFCKSRITKGVILIANGFVQGEIQNPLSGTVLYLKGEMDRKTKDIVFELIDINETIGVAEGFVNSQEGHGSWASNRCFGTWKAVIEK